MTIINLKVSPMLWQFTNQSQVFGFLAAAFVCCSQNTPAWAQNDNHQAERQITIGDLSGRTDIRELAIPTRVGRIAVAASGNGKPFEIVNLTPQILELLYESSFPLDRNNPNKIAYKFYETERALISALILEEVDFAVLENEVSASEVSQSNSHFLPYPFSTEPNAVKLIVYNQRNAILRTTKVRVALAYGINHEHIVKKIILGGKADIARGPFDEKSPLYNPGMESYKFNPKIAITLLSEAGWTDTDGDGILDKGGAPFRINLSYQKGLSIDEEISRQVKINLIKIGVDVIPRPLPKSRINEQLASGEFDAVLMDYTFENNVESLQAFFSMDGEKNCMG
ncbi:MAG TPA: ABC transporter substrate-binding protein, partial [bacterium]